MNGISKHIALWLVIGVLLLVCFMLFENAASTNAPSPATKLAYSAFVEDVTKGQIQDVTIAGSNVSGKLRNGEKFATYAPNDPGLADRLIAKGIEVNVTPSRTPCRRFGARCCPGRRCCC